MIKDPIYTEGDLQDRLKAQRLRLEELYRTQMEIISVTQKKQAFDVRLKVLRIDRGIDGIKIIVG